MRIAASATSSVDQLTRDASRKPTDGTQIEMRDNSRSDRRMTTSLVQSVRSIWVVSPDAEELRSPCPALRRSPCKGGIAGAAVSIWSAQGGQSSFGEGGQAMNGHAARSKRYRVVVGVFGGLTACALLLLVVTLFTGPNSLIVSNALVFVFLLASFLFARQNKDL